MLGKGKQLMFVEDYSIVLVLIFQHLSGTKNNSISRSLARKKPSCTNRRNIKFDLSYILESLENKRCLRLLDASDRLANHGLLVNAGF